MSTRFAWLSLAAACLLAGCLPSKEEVTTGGMKLDPLAQLETAVKAGNEEAAKKLLEQALNGPDRSLATYIRARDAYAKALRYEDGMKIMQRGLENLRGLTQKEIAEVHRYLGGDAFAMKDYVTCKTEYALAYSLDPESPQIQNDYAYYLAEKGGDLKKAKQLAAQALERTQDSSNALDTMGWVYFRMGEATKAIEFLERAYREDSQNLEFQYHLAQAYELAGRKADSVARYAWVVKNGRAHKDIADHAGARLKVLDMEAYAKATSLKN